ncbi:restriction endonuclease subunit S [Stomatobaculum longum]
MAERRVPRIRFKGFEEDWEQRKVSELADRYDNLRVPVAEKLRVRGTTPYYGANGIQDYVRGFTHDGEFVLVAEDGANDLKNYPVQYVNGRIWVNNHAHVLQAKDKIADTRFLGYAVSRADIEAILVGGGRAKLNAEVLMRLALILPGRTEQIRLASFLVGIDSLLSLHQRKLEKLKILKKAMLEKMFPKNGAKVPEIRFSGFTEDWEQRKFSDLYEKSSEKNDGSIGVDRNITVASMQFKTDVRVNTVEYLKTYYTFRLGDIAFEGHQSKEFRFGRFVENDIGDGIVSHIFVVFRPVGHYDLRYWKYAINNEKLMQHVLSRSTKASTMMHDLVEKDFLNESLLVPSFKEQQSIGEFLFFVDRSISLHQRKLEKLRQIKKSMLERMFV